MSTTPQRIAVMGAGAVGCYFGGMLARAGHALVMIGRPAHVQAMIGHGLRLQTTHFDETVQVAASTDAAAVAGADVVLVCVKSADTETAARDMAPHLDADALLVSLQNGVDNAPRLAAALPGHAVAAAVVYVGTEMVGPGHVRHHGRGELLLGPTPRSAELAQLFCAAGVPTEVCDNVDGALWTKLVINCAWNALSAITQLPYGQVLQGSGVTAVIDDVVAECLAVARAEGIELPRDIASTVNGIGVSLAGQYSSTAQDLARGKPSEIGHLNGYVVRRGAAHGIATPVNRTLLALVQLLERKHQVVSDKKGL